MEATNIHICTDNDFFVDAPKITVECKICGVVCESEIGYIGMRCSQCGSIYDPFEITVPDIVKKRRELLGFSRKVMAKKSGYSHKTIKKYELVKCTEAYFNKTREFIKNNKPKTSNLKPQIMSDNIDLKKTTTYCNACKHDRVALKRDSNPFIYRKRGDETRIQTGD